MSLRQWFAKKLPLNKSKKIGPNADSAAGYSTITPELSRESLTEGFWLFILAGALALLLIPVFFLIPKLYDLARATTWSITEDFDTTGDVGRYGAMTLNASTLPATIYYDRTNSKAKYAQRSGAGSWTIEDVESFGADYNFGFDTDRNTKFAIAIDPSDNKISAAYCKYGSPAATSQLRYAHRVGDGSGNCGTSNNWSCSSVGSTNDSCDMRMLSLAFHASSTQPTLSYIQGSVAILKFAEYNGATWSVSTALGFDGGMVYDRNQTALSYTSSSEPIIFLTKTNGAFESYAQYTYRKLSNWTWQTPVTMDWAVYASSNLKSTNISVAKDSSDIFHLAWSINGYLRYGRLNGSTLTTSTVDATTSSTWNSIAIMGSQPAIAYADETNNDLKYAAFNGTTWALEAASSTNSLGDYTSLVAIGGQPTIFYYDRTGANASFISAASFNQTPTAATTPYAGALSAQAGSTDPTNLATSTPAFSAIFNDPDVSDTATKAQIELTTSAVTFGSPTHWNSGILGNTIASVANGVRSANIYFGSFGTAPSPALALGDDGVEGGTNTTYYWHIRFWDASGVVSPWAATSTFSLLDRPLPPTNLVATLSETASTITWSDNSSIEDAVEVVRSTDNVAYAFHASSTAANDLTTSTIGFSPNQLYYFKARAYNAAGYSTYSSATSGYTLANPPTGVTASSSAYDTANITWGANSNPTSSTYYVLNVTAGTNSGWNAGTSHAFTGLQGAKLYTFQVKARNDATVETAYSSIVTTTTLPNAPSSLTAAQNGTSANLSWSVNGNSTGATYTVENQTTGQSTVVAGTVTTYSFSGLDVGTTYSFRVKASNSDGISSAYSSSALLTITAATPSNASASSQSQQAEQQSQAQAQKKQIIVTFKIAQPGATTGFTSSTAIYIDTTFSANVSEMMFANDPGFDQGIWKAAQQHTKWTIIGGSGTRTVYAKFRTTDGIVSDVLADSITLDLTPPINPKVTVPQDKTAFTTEKPLFAGFSEAGTYVHLVAANSKNTFVIGNAGVDSLGAWSIVSPVPLFTGTYTLYATAYDKAGNSSGDATLTFSVVDQNPPRAPSVTFPQANSSIAASMITTYGSAEPLSKIQIVKDNINTYSLSANATGDWVFKFPVAFGLGQHKLEYFALDNSNNESAHIIVMFGIDANGDAPLIVLDVIPPKVEPIIEPPVIKPPTKQDLGTQEPIPGKNHIDPIPAAPGQPDVTVSDPVVSKLDEGPAVSNPITEPAAVSATASEVYENIKQQTQIILTRAAETTKKIVKAARVIADKPAVQIANKVVVVPASAVVAIASVGTVVNGSQFFVYLRFLFAQPLMLLYRRRRKQWGMAYNAITKLPIDLAVVRLVDTAQNRIIQSRVTDRAGRYQFFAAAGEYVIEIAKPDFAFPPAYLKGKKEDRGLSDVYTGEAIPVAKATSVSYNLPLDPNGVEKPTVQILKEAAKKRLATLFSASGLIVTAVSFVVTPTLLVGAFLAGHIGSYFLFRRLALGSKPKSWGVVFDKATHAPLEHAVIRIFDTQYNKLLETQVTDAKGRYAFLVGKNEYYVMVERQGYEKFISKPIAIEAGDEGSLLAVDIPVAAGGGAVAAPVEITPSVEPAVSAPTVPPQYMPKALVPEMQMPHTEQNGVAAKLLSTLERSPAIKIDPEQTLAHSIVLAPSPEPVLTLEKTPEMTSHTAATEEKPVVLGQKGFTNLLLGEVGNGSRNMIITGLPSSISPRIVPNTTDGNFLTAIEDKK